jgi:radical SAM protein with 4Fe4S-binding SPASM domain
MTQPGHVPPSALARLNNRLAMHALERGSGIALHRPVDVYLQVASACNLDCYMCSEHNRPEDQRFGRGLRCMSSDLFEKLEKEVFPWSTRVWFGVGGEPTIAEHFAQFLVRAARAGQEIHLTTNGTRFEHGDLAEVIAREVTHLHVSLDAATAETYERIRRGSRWDRVMRGIEKLNSFRGANGRCRLSLSFVLMRSNVHELPAFVALAHELGADSVLAQHVIPVTEEGKHESLIVEPEKYDRFRAEAEALARKLSIDLQTPNPYALAATIASGEPSASHAGDAPSAPHAADERSTSHAGDEASAPYAGDEAGVLHASDGARAAPASSPCASARCAREEARASTSPLGAYAVPCSLPNSSVFVLYDGRVFPCCHPFAHQKMQLGDLRTQSFAAIWNDRIYRNLRTGMKSGDVPTICRKCSAVHNPPRAFEDPDELGRSPDIAAHYDGRDLDPLGPADITHLLERTGASAYAAELQHHADALEAERPHLKGHIENLEAERPHLVGHIANLEREVARIRPLFSFIRRWKRRARRVLMPWRRAGSPESSVRGADIRSRGHEPDAASPSPELPRP